MDLKTETPLIVTLLTEKAYVLQYALNNDSIDTSVTNRPGFKMETLNEVPLFDQGFTADLQSFAKTLLQNSAYLSAAESDESVRSHSQQIITTNFNAANHFFAKQDFLEGNRYLTLACSRICKVMERRSIARVYDDLHKKFMR